VDYVRVYDIHVPNGIQAYSKNEQIKMFPNPGNEQLTVSWEPQMFHGEPGIDIINATGQVVKSFSRVQNNSILGINDLQKGIYLVSFRHGGNIEYMRFIKS
jgi:hypothetical protein